MLKIGNVSIPSRCILAPLAGISDQPFRMINRSFGCEFAFTEMISSSSLVHQRKKTFRMLSFSSDDRPIGVQLLGSDPDIIARALDILLEQYEFDLLDFNAACPANKVTGKGKGSGLLKEPLRLHALLKLIVNNCRLPVTVKIRSGWDDTSLNAREVALYARDAGIQGLTIHGRTRAQGYAGRVNYGIIREVKESLDIPVIASGDALSPRQIKRLFDETGCDGVSIARGGLGNPWIFRETAQFLQSGTVPQRPDLDEVAETMRRHLDLCCDFYEEKTGTMIFRKFFGWYTRGIPRMNVLKDRAFHAKTKEQMLATIRALSTPGEPRRKL